MVVVHQMPNGIISIITKSSRLVHHNFGRYRKGTVAHTGKRSIKPKILGQKKNDSLAEIGTAMWGQESSPRKSIQKLELESPFFLLLSLAKCQFCRLHFFKASVLKFFAEKKGLCSG